MRAITFYFVGGVLIAIALVKHVIRGNLNLVGGAIGLISGFLLSVVLLRRAFRLARSGIFVESASPHQRKIMIFVIFPACIVLGAAIPFVNKLYFPQFDFLAGYGSGFQVCVFIVSWVGLVGTYIIERHYGEKFYIGKFKK